MKFGFGESSNGRTVDSGSINGGSSPPSPVVLGLPGPGQEREKMNEVSQRVWRRKFFLR